MSDNITIHFSIRKIKDIIAEVADQLDKWLATFPEYRKKNYREELRLVSWHRKSLTYSVNWVRHD